MSQQLKYLSDRALTQLRAEIAHNIARYRKEGFADFAGEPGWDIPLGVEFDDQRLSQLDLSQPQHIAPIDLKNSLIVGQALAGLDRSTANEERVWVRLAHIEAFKYSNARWISTIPDEKVPESVATHFFAPTQTGIRDDQALSRLWWNYEIARICMPDDVEGALALILKTADIRSNFVERIWMTSRQKIAGSVLRSMRDEAWITEAEKNFREFMKALNRLGGGIVFEALSERQCDSFVQECIGFAKAT